MDATSLIVDLAERHSTDLDVVLLWARRSGRLWVVVTHRPTGKTARIAASASNALDVFNHPFAYAEAASATVVAHPASAGVTAGAAHGSHQPEEARHEED